MTTPSHMRPGMPERGSYDDLLKDLERRMRALETAARLPFSSIGEGGITVLDGGQIVFLDPAGDPLTILDSSGLMVGPDVVIDEQGLKIDGILQPALAVVTASDSANHTPTTSEITVNQIDFSIPSWADEVTLITLARSQAVNNTGASHGVTNQLINDITGLAETTDDFTSIPTGHTMTSFVALTTTVTSFGATISCAQTIDATANLNSGEQRLEGIAIVRRTT